MKKLLLPMMAGLALLSLASCGSQKKSGEVTVWWPGGSDAEIAVMHKAKEMYELENPDVTIKIVPQSTTDFYMAYNMSLQGQDYPDIAYVDHVYVQRLMYDGSIANLSEMGFDSEKDKFLESTWTPNTYEGDLYALPISANVLVTAYNKTLLKEVTGIDYTNDTLPKDYNEFKILADKFVEYNTKNNNSGDAEVFPMTLPAGSGHESMSAMTFLSFVAREGGKIISDDLKTMTLDSPECLAAAKKINEMGKKNYTTRVFEEAKFEAGKVGFIEMGPWKFQDYDRIAEQRNIEFGYAPIMKLNPNGSNESALGLFSMVVTDMSPNREIAADFVKFVATNDELQLLHNKPQNLMPATKKALQDEYYSTERWSVFRDQLENVVARPGSPEWPTIEQELAGFVTQLIANSREPEYLTDLNYVLQETIDSLYE